MPRLEWSDALSLDLPLMDDTHREFVDLLADVESASDNAALLARFEALIDHTDDHFGREDRWMRDTGFAAINCHASQHEVVLKVLREGLQRARVGDFEPARQMAYELASWFPQHAQTMDAALALHLRGVGYDPASGEVRSPDALPRQDIAGCGGSTCGDRKHA
ncbi:MAG: hemerythrin domain-containing protein [Burkholderiales bacterium]|nr:hemerythrin domain-containing protein [Burkholderiales bacterium]